MHRGKRFASARFPLPWRLAAAVPLGTLFVGSGLVGLPAPAAAAADPAAPVLTFTPAFVSVSPGDSATTALHIAAGVSGNQVCLYDLAVDNGFRVTSEPGPSAPATATITGEPEATAQVTATITYSEVEQGTGCPDSPADPATADSQAPFIAAVEPETPEPTPSDPPTTDPPTSEPPEESSPPPATSPPPDQSSPPTTSPTGGSPPTGDSPTATDGSGDQGGQSGQDGGGTAGSGDGGQQNRNNGGDGGSSGSSSGGSGGNGGGSGGDHAPSNTPVGNDGPADPGGGAVRPDLPTGAPDLPGPDSPPEDGPLSPSEGGPLAELPSVEPGEKDDSTGTTEVASRQETPASMVTPAVLVLFLLLLLLFSTPLAPSRRVRLGPNTYKGRRRKE